LIKRTHYTSELRKAIGKNVSLLGWVHDLRILGGINFLLLRDKEGIAQITAPREKVPPEILEIFKKLHQEDVIAVEGKVVKSKVAKTGLEVIPSKIEVLSKASVPLPLDPRGITKTNLDTQIEWRVLYFRTQEAKAIFKIQAEIIRAFREFCEKEGTRKFNHQ
jgi:aspartyl-tRNA synthetase